MEYPHRDLAGQVPLGGAVDHVEVDGVLARLGRGPLAGGGSGGLLGDAPLGPAALLPDELVLEAGGVAGHLGLQLDRLAAAGAPETSSDSRDQLTTLYLEVLVTYPLESMTSA